MSDNKLVQAPNIVNEGLLKAEDIPANLIDTSLKEVTVDDLKLLQAALSGVRINKWKNRLQGTPGTAKKKPIRFWYNGNLISKEEHDKLSWEEIHAYNNKK